MKNIFLIVFLLSFFFRLSAQVISPSYIDIIKTFCSNYEASEDYYNYTAFAKKKDGWYIIQVNKMQDDSLLTENLFFSFSENKYLDLNGYYNKPAEPDVNKQIDKYLGQGGGTSDWYGFERIAYYGYNGWYSDMIKDFGDRQDLSDTMYDGLGRSYGNLVSSYLWYQYGGMFPEDDTLHRKLGRLEYPTQQRIEKLKEAIDSTISQFGKLSRLNPTYKTIVGNASLKLFNEHIHGYSQLLLCGDQITAKKYLETAPLPEPYVIQAKNYLNSCDTNAILFTYGDNDTYSLWYVQEKFNYRKDIVVINNSLLGLPAYIDMLRKNKLIYVSVPGLYLKDIASDIIYYKENEKITGTKQTIPLKEFLNIVYTKKYLSTSAEGISYPSYPYSTVSLTLPAGGNKPTNATAKKNIVFSLNKNYLFLNDIATLDIISNNINSRPVYFTSLYNGLFENNLMQKGIVYKLIAEDINEPLQKAIEIKALEKFINEKYIPVLSNETGITSFDGDNSFFGSYYAILNYYLVKRDTVNLKKWLYKLDAACPKINSTQIAIARMLAYYYFEVGDKKKALDITDQYAQWLNMAYTKPGSLTGYYSKEKYIDELTKTKNFLESKGVTSTLIDDLLENK